MQSNPLVLYAQARTLIQHLASCDDLNAAKEIADKAAALKSYAQLAHDPALEIHIAEIRLRARLRMGQLSAALPKATGINLPNVAAPRHPGKRQALQAAGISKDEAHRCEQLARLDASLLETAIEEKKATQTPFTADDIVRAVAKKTRKENIAKRTEIPNLLVAADLDDLANQGLQFGTIYADPPWEYDNRATRGAATNHYPTMSLEQLAQLPVGKLAADDSHLHLWTTNAFLFDAKVLMEAWGFEYKSCFIWTKPNLGIGNYWRVSHEFLLLGVRGACTFSDRSLRSWGQFDRGPHSAKPEQVREFIQLASPGPRLELFGRRVAPGWVVWGNEVERLAPNSEIQVVAA